jgi:hypothetical protein
MREKCKGPNNPAAGKPHIQFRFQIAFHRRAPEIPNLIDLPPASGA